MTYPPQGEHEDPDRHATQPAPSFERPAQPAQQPWQGPTQPYGQPAQTYTQPQPQPGYGPLQQPYGSPPYGQPWQQPAPTAAPAGPAQKSKVGLIAAVTGVILLVIAGVTVALLALQSTMLDPAAVERDVATQFEEREGVPVELSCDDEMTVETGRTYSCTGTTADGEDVRLEIRIEDEDSARYTWTEP